MKFKDILLVIILSFICFNLAKANWYDNHLAFNLAVNCNNYVHSGAEIGVTPNSNISAWIEDLEHQCNNRSIIAYPEPVSLSEACPVLEASPTEAFVIYNDLVRISNCGDSFKLFN